MDWHGCHSNFFFVSESRMSIFCLKIKNFFSFKNQEFIFSFKNQEFIFSFKNQDFFFTFRIKVPQGGAMMSAAHVVTTSVGQFFTHIRHLLIILSFPKFE